MCCDKMLNSQKKKKIPFFQSRTAFFYSHEIFNSFSSIPQSTFPPGKERERQMTFQNEIKVFYHFVIRSPFENIKVRSVTTKLLPYQTTIRSHKHEIILVGDQSMQYIPLWSSSTLQQQVKFFCCHFTCNFAMKKKNGFHKTNKNQKEVIRFNCSSFQRTSSK